MREKPKKLEKGGFLGITQSWRQKKRDNEKWGGITKSLEQICRLRIREPVRQTAQLCVIN
jgi:hypothetical protein